MIVIRNCRLVKALTEGYDGETADVCLNGKLIEAIRPVGFDFEGDYTEIDAEGKTLIPGLIEMHTHLYSYTFNPYELLCSTPGQYFFGAIKFMNAYLDAGYTTVRDCGSPSGVVAAVRDAVNEGIIQGPRLISSGLIITPTESGNDTFANIYYEADGPEEFRKAARKQLQEGNDFVKITASGSFMNEGGDPGVQIIEPEEIRAAVKVAKRKETYVSAHCHSASSIKAAITEGVRTVEHGCFIDDECIELLKNTTETYLVPTGAVSMYCANEDGSSDVSAETQEIQNRLMDAEISSINKAYHAGLKLGFGSDLDLEAFNYQPGYEFVARKKFYTFDDLDILIQATKNSSEILGFGDTLGTIKEGKIADLVIVDGNPDEDIYVMTKPTVHVIKDGKIVK